MMNKTNQETKLLAIAVMIAAVGLMTVGSIAQQAAAISEAECGIGAGQSGAATTDGRSLGQGTAEAAQSALESGGNEGQDQVSGPAMSCSSR